MALPIALACSVGSDGSDEIVARVNDRAITVADVEAEMLRRATERRQSFSTLEQRKALLGEMVRNAVLIENALDAGYGEDPEVVAGLGRLLVAAYRHDQMENRLTSVEPSEDEIERVYREESDHFAISERVRAAIILIRVRADATPEHREKKRRKADAALRAAHQEETHDAAFGALAVRYSEDQVTRYRGGNIGWIERGDARWDAELVDGIFALQQPGDLSPLIMLPSGVAIAKLLDRRPADVRPLEEVRDTIRARLIKRKRELAYERFLEESRSRVRIELYSARLESLPAPAMPEPTPLRPPPPPGG